MSHLRSRALKQKPANPRNLVATTKRDVQIPVRKPAPIKPALQMTGWYAKGVLRNIGATFHDNKMQSFPLLAGVAVMMFCQWLHVAVDEPSHYGIWAAVPAIFCAYVCFVNIQNDPKAVEIGQYARLTVGFAWIGLAISEGVNGPMFAGGAGIVASWYGSFFKMLVTVNGMPQTQLILPPAAPEEKQVGRFDHISWLKGAELSAPRSIPTGTEETLTLPDGTSVKQFVKTRTHQLASVLKVAPIKLELIDPGLDQPVVTIRKHTSMDVLAQPRAWPWADLTVTDTKKPMPLGLNRSGEVRSLPLRKGHILIGGTTGSGKSVTIAAITAALALDPNVDTYGIDPKRADLRAFRHSMRAYVQDDYKGALRVLTEVADSIPKRMELTDEFDVENVADLPPLEDGRQRVPTTHLIIDELAHLTVDAPKDIRDEAIRLIGIVLKQGRAADVWLVAATQRPSEKTVPTDLRAQFRYALCLRVRESVTTGMVLGDGTGVDASEIPDDRPGTGWLLTDTGLEYIRGSWLPPDEKLRLAKLAPAAIGTVEAPKQLASAHPLLPVEEGGVERLPNGDPVPPGWKGELWRILTDGKWHSVPELAQRVGKTNNPVRALVREWTEGRLLAKSDGLPERFKRAA